MKLPSTVEVCFGCTCPCSCHQISCKPVQDYSDDEDDEDEDDQRRKLTDMSPSMRCHFVPVLVVCACEALHTGRAENQSEQELQQEAEETQDQTA